MTRQWLASKEEENIVKMTAEEATVASTEKALEAAEEKKSLKSNPEDPSSAGVGFDLIHFYILQFQFTI